MERASGTEKTKERVVQERIEIEKNSISGGGAGGRKSQKRRSTGREDVTYVRQKFDQSLREVRVSSIIGDLTIRST